MEEVVESARHRKREDACRLAAGVMETMNRPLRAVNDRPGGNLLCNEIERGIRVYSHHKRYGPLFYEEGLPLVAMRMRVGSSTDRVARPGWRHLEIERAEPPAGFPVCGQRRVQVRRQVMTGPLSVILLANDTYARHWDFRHKALRLDSLTIKTLGLTIADTTETYAHDPGRGNRYERTHNSAHF